MSGRTTIIAIITFATFILLIIGWRITDRKPLKPVSRDNVVFIEGLGNERRAIDVTEVIGADEFIALKDFIIDNGEMELISNLFGEVPAFTYWLNNEDGIHFSFYEGYRVGRQFDQIHILNFADTLDCWQYDLQYYPDGFDRTGIIFDNSFGDPNNRWSSMGDIRNYVDGHVYLVGHYHEIKDENLMKQLAYYYSLLMRKS